MKTAISLGWDCEPAIWGVVNNLRGNKADGYKTCPFDRMITNYNGMVECINDDFKYLCDPEYLKVITGKDIYCHLNFPVGTTLLINTKYNFIFNHESSGHGDLWQSEKWPKGKFHFEMNNFEEFIIRYSRRVENFKYYLNNFEEITLITSKVDNTHENNSELENAIKKKYSKPKINFILKEEERKEIFNEGLHVMNEIKEYYANDNYKVCFIIANKYVRNSCSFLDYYVSNIQKFYKDSLILIVDNNSEILQDVRERLEPYKSPNLILLTNNSDGKFELGAYKVGINYILSNNLLNEYNYYVFSQDSFILKNKYDFNNLVQNNIFAMPIKTHINDSCNRHAHDYYSPLVQKILKRLHLEDKIDELRLCWANSFVLHKSKVEQFMTIVFDIITKNKDDACECERFLSPILYTLNNYKNSTLENIYAEEEVDPLWSVDVPTIENKKHFFIKKINNKH